MQRALVGYNVAYLQALAELHTSFVEIEGLLLTNGLSGETTRPVDSASGGRD